MTLFFYDKSLSDTTAFFPFRLLTIQYYVESKWSYINIIPAPKFIKGTNVIKLWNLSFFVLCGSFRSSQSTKAA